MKRVLSFNSLGILLIIWIALFGCSQKLQPVQSTTSANQALVAVTPEKVGMSTVRLTRIDSLMGQYIHNKWLAGGVTLIARHGKIAYYQSWGMNDIEKNDLMHKDDIFRIASMTKAITSVAVMMLYEEGKFLLDDPVSLYIPQFKNPKVVESFHAEDTSYTTKPAKSEITIRHLLTHTSGIGYGFTDPKTGAMYGKAGIIDAFTTRNLKLGDKMKALGGLPLLHNPGEKWTYGLSVDVLGYLVEVVSGMSLAEFFQQRIFTPLGMHDTYFYLPAEKANRLVTLYSENKSGVIEKTPVNRATGVSPNFPIEGAKTYFSGGGGLSSTALDYAKFLQMVLNGGNYNGNMLLSRKTVELMTMNQIGDLWLEDNKFGLGFSIVSEKARAKSPASVGTFGWGGIFNTNYWVDPKEDILVVIMTQVLPTSHKELFDKLEVLTYQSLVEVQRH